MCNCEMISNIAIKLTNEIDKCIAGTISSNLKDYNININIEKIVETLENAEKYNWHDLKHNSEDLPTRSKEYNILCCCYSPLLDKKIYHLTRFDGNFCIFRGKLTQREILAWKYIYPFKEKSYEFEIEPKGE